MKECGVLGVGDLGEVCYGRRWRKEGREEGRGGGEEFYLLGWEVWVLFL